MQQPLHPNLKVETKCANARRRPRTTVTRRKPRQTPACRSLGLMFWTYTKTEKTLPTMPSEWFKESGRLSRRWHRWTGSWQRTMDSETIEPERQRAFERVRDEQRQFGHILKWNNGHIGQRQRLQSKYYYRKVLLILSTTVWVEMFSWTTKLNQNVLH